jgi:uncharacterized cupin superfamily protein
VLVSDEGEQTLSAGLAAAFPAGRANGHHLVNRGTRTARFLAIGTRSAHDECSYPDIDLHVASKDGKDRWTDKKGRPY